MLNLSGQGVAHTCGGATRRDFLQAGSLGAAGLTMAQYARAKETGGVKPGHDERSCIMIFNLGAPSQLDTFDMKPEAPAEVARSVPSDCHDRGLPDFGNSSETCGNRGALFAGALNASYGRRRA